MQKAGEELSAIADLVKALAAGWIVGFHCQQVTEKALKAVLVSKGEAPERTHDIVHLIRAVGATGLNTPDWFWELENLNPYSVRLRYENVGTTGELAAGDAEVLALRVYKWAESMLGQSETASGEDELPGPEPVDGPQ